MRKILLATTALVGFAVAGAAQAATAPLNVTVGGSVDFLAGAFNQANTGDKAARYDFETLYSLNFGIAGKAANGIEYGGTLTLDNYPGISEQDNELSGNGDRILVKTASIFMSGAYGKVVLGDMRGATDLAIAAPTVGAGQVFGRYTDFLKTSEFAKFAVYGVDGTDHGTNITYYTPKVGNDMHKVQAGVTFEPNFADAGGHVIKYQSLADYTNVIKGAVAYTGTFKPVTVAITAHIVNAAAKQATSPYRPSTTWGVGAQAAAEGFTLGASYADFGHFGTDKGQNKDQQEWSAGLKYEIGKIGVAFSYLGANGYDNRYVKDFSSYGLGGTYTWAPGLTSNADVVLFDQERTGDIDQGGYVFLVSQKLAF